MEEKISKIDLLLKVVNLTPTKLNRFIFLVSIMGLCYVCVTLFNLYVSALVSRIDYLEKDNIKKDVTINGLRMEVSTNYDNCNERVDRLNEKLDRVENNEEKLIKK